MSNTNIHNQAFSDPTNSLRPIGAAAGLAYNCPGQNNLTASFGDEAGSNSTKRARNDSNDLQQSSRGGVGSLHNSSHNVTALVVASPPIDKERAFAHKDINRTNTFSNHLKSYVPQTDIGRTNNQYEMQKECEEQLRIDVRFYFS